MRISNFLAATALAACLPFGALAADYEVRRVLELPHQATEVWHVVGDFCDIDDWHPDIAACATRVIDGRLHRVVTTGDGAEWLHQRIASEPGLSYTYRLTNAALPVERYTATFSVEPLDGAVVSWSVRFTSDDPAVEAAVTAFIEAGLAAIDAAFAD